MSIRGEIATEARDIERARRMKAVDCTQLNNDEWSAFEAYYTNGGRCDRSQEGLIDRAISRLGELA